MKVKGIIILAAVITFVFILTGCEDITDIIALDDGETHNYTGMNSSFNLEDAELTITNGIGSNIYSVYLLDSADNNIEYSDDMLEDHVIKRGNTNYIVGVPALNDCDVELTFTEDAVYNAIYSNGAENFDFADYDYWINVSIDLDDSGRGIANDDPNTTVTVQDSIVVTITRIPR
jgi:hypothetical protein